jgi:hypothetical protein
MSAYMTAMLESSKTYVIEELMRQKERAEKAEAECKRLQAAFDEQLDECIHLNAANDAEQKRADRAFAAGARAFAEWMLNQGWVIDYGSAHGRENVVDACDEFLASQRGDGEEKEG